MVQAGVAVLRERGAAGVTIDAVVSRIGAPRGSVYYHFPDGRSQIVTEALESAAAAYNDVLGEAPAEGAVAALERFSRLLSSILNDSDFEAGCAVVSVAVGGSIDDKPLLPAVAEIFRNWHQHLTMLCVEDGVPAKRAEQLATMAVAAIEGAVILCRVQRTTAPLDTVMAMLVEQVKDAVSLPVSR